MAHNNSWEIRKPCVPRDIISELPDEILLQILSSSIPTNDVVKTSTLSKRWRSLWTFVDAVEINDLGSNSRTSSDDGFMNFVDNVLNHAVVIQKLRLSCSYLFFNDMSRVKQWINIVLDDDYGTLDELDLSFLAGELVELPIFTSKKLVILNLSNQIVINVAAWLPSLKVIHFNSVSNLDVSLENILAGCPVLEELSLIGDMQNKLKEKKRLCVKSFSLKSLTLRCDILDIEIEAPNLEELDVQNEFVISNTNLPLLKSFKIVIPCYFLYNLLEIAPNIVSCVLHINEFLSQHFQPKRFRSPNNNGLKLEFLETVEFTEFRGCDQEMNLVNYFLKNAPVLKKMTIIFLSGEVAACLRSRIVELPKACQVKIELDADKDRTRCSCFFCR